jgi:alpha-L-rhamnosidase
MLLLALLVTLVAGQQSHTAERMRIEYLDSPLSIDVLTPRFSYALLHPTRAQYQTTYHIVVSSLNPQATVWDSGVVTSNNTLNIPYAGGTPLASDPDYQWTVTWADNTGALSTPATAFFSTALYDPTWQGASWVSSQTNGSLNTYRTTFTLASIPTRARLYIHGLGYAKTWINGGLTDNHELGDRKSVV